MITRSDFQVPAALMDSSSTSSFSLTSFKAVLMKRRLAKETIFLSYADKLAFYWLIFEESFHLFYV